MTSSASENELVLPLSPDFQANCLSSLPLEEHNQSFQPIPTTSPEPVLSQFPSPAMQGVASSAHVPTSDNVSLSTQSPEYPTFKIVGIDIDKSVKLRFMHYNSQSRSLHFTFNHYAVKDSTDICHLSDIPLPLPSSDLSTLAESLLPSSLDNEILANTFTHVSRILTSSMPFFKEAEGTVLRHIPHRYQLKWHKSQQW